MNDTINSNMEPSAPIVPVTPSKVRQYIFAQLSHDVQGGPLVTDNVEVQSPSSALPNFVFERRRLFQRLLCRYQRQILNGCRNFQCDTLTCLSYRKRVSTSPFRGFTTLSAWTLATFLATQDDPEAGLCPHEPVTLTQGPEQYLKPREINTAQGSSENTTPEDASPGQHGKMSNTTNSPHRKDSKSFSQNLFDVVPMKILQLMKVPAGYLEWEPWVDTRDPAVSVQNRDIATKTENRSEKDEAQVRDSAQSEFSIPEQNRATEKPSASNVAQRQKWSQMKAFSPGLWPNKQYHVKKTLNLPDSAMIASGSSRTLENIRNSWEVDDGFAKYIFASLYQDQPLWKPWVDIHKNGSDYLVDDMFPTVPVTANAGFITPPQSLSKCRMENIDALIAMCRKSFPRTFMEQKNLRDLGRTNRSFCLDSLVSGSATQREREVAFISQSIILVLSSVDSLLQSFRPCDTPEFRQPRYIVGFSTMVSSFQLLDLVDFYPRSVLSSLWISIGKLYPPKSPCSPSSTANRGLRSEPSESCTGCPQSSTGDNALNDNDARHIARITLAALVASVPLQTQTVWDSFCLLHAGGREIYNNPGCHETLEKGTLELMDVFDDEMAIGLMTRLVKGMVAREYMAELTKSHNPDGQTGGMPSEGCENMIDRLLQHTLYLWPSHQTTEEGQDRSRYWTAILVQWLLSVILKNWDGKPTVSRWGAVGCAVEFMHRLYLVSSPLDVPPTTFHIPFISNQFDILDIPLDWLSIRDRNTAYLISASFIFPRNIRVTHLRAANHATMHKAYQGSLATAKLEENMASRVYPRGQIQLHDRLRVATNVFLVLKVGRENILTDTLNQLWRREKCELMRPLRVCIGDQEGEEGIDHGGVQQEFMGLLFSEIMRPDYGMFTTDAETQMSWFHPLSLEPLFKFELLGLIASLAVYNGLTLPVTFPLALYRKLLNLPVTWLEHIQDGWPSVAKGLQKLLDWADGDVEEVFDLSYDFKFEDFGMAGHVDLNTIKYERIWPSCPPSRKLTGYPTDWSINCRSSDSEPCSSSVTFDPLADGDQADVANDSTSSESESGRSSTYFDSLTDGNQIDGANGSASSESEPGRLSTCYDSSADMRSWNGLPEIWDLSSSGPPNRAMKTPMNSLASEACMVTNQNRDCYVADYVFWLTERSVWAQYAAFARGFNVCVNTREMAIFTPEDLKMIVEGIQEIDVGALQRATKYDGIYDKCHRVIIDFWHVVHELPPASLKQLLEFVTASDRVPVNGIASIKFYVQRSGDDDHRLPTSMTCFNRLLLPEYSSREILKERLSTALVHCKGFGVP